MGSRVVPATESTNARSVPAIALSKLDFPTFGRPTSTTRLGASTSDFKISLGNISMTRSNKSPLPRPCKAETGMGSPKPSCHNSCTNNSASALSTLFAINKTGVRVLRICEINAISSSIAPTVASTTIKTKSASSIAISALCATFKPKPVKSGSHPPVSINAKERPAHSAS